MAIKYGTAGDDTIIGTVSNDLLYGLGGRDFLYRWGMIQGLHSLARVGDRSRCSANWAMTSSTVAPAMTGSSSAISVIADIMEDFSQYDFIDLTQGIDHYFVTEVSSGSQDRHCRLGLQSRCRSRLDCAQWRDGRRMDKLGWGVRRPGLAGAPV